MDYDVEREQGQWHIQEKGQVTRGTTVTDAWMEQMGFGQLSRTNIEAVVNATMAGGRGVVLDPSASRRLPRDIDFTPKSASYRQGALT